MQVVYDQYCRFLAAQPSDPDALIDDPLASWEQPHALAPCRIAIADYEQPGRTCTYGWDGQRFLGERYEL